MSTGRGSYSFSALFLTRATFWRKYDAFVRVPISATSSITATTAATDAMQQIESDTIADMLCDKPLQTVVGDQAVAVLSKGLNDRVKLVRPLYGAAGEHSNDFIGIPGTTASSITSTVTYSSINSNGKKSVSSSSVAPKFVQSQSTDATVCIGLQLDTSTAMRSVDRGPTADDHDAATAFRQFWGTLSELRRFKDGAIVEAVVWSGTKHSIIEQIVRHCLARHLPLRCADSSSTIKKQQQPQQYRVQYIGGNSLISAVIAAQSAVTTATADDSANGSTDNRSSKSSTALLQQQSLTLPTDDDALTRLAITAFDTLATTLKDLQGLPLRVDVVTPASSHLRYTAVVPPVTHPMANSSKNSSSVALWNMSSARALGRITNQIDPIQVVIRFESSSKWPTDSVSAIQHTSVAFLIRLSQCLEQQHQISSAIVTYDNCDAAMLDVLLDGYCFRLTICNDHEITALQDKAAQGDMQAKAAAVALIQHTKQRPQHHSFIHSMHSRYTVYGPVVRLALKWINTHMLSDHIPVEAIELLVASLWTQSSPLQLPNSVLSGFMRFLVLLCSHDWQQAPLIVDFHNELSSTDIAAISESCASCRARGGLTSSTSSSASSNVPQTTAPAHCSMYLIASYDKASNSGGNNSSNSSTTSSQQWIPSWTKTTPEHAVLGRVKALAQVSLSTLLQWITSTTAASSSSNTAHETASVTDALGWQSVFKLSKEEVATFNVKIKINSMLCADSGNSVSGADTLYKHKVKGCKALRLKLYKNMATGLHASQLYIGFEPVHELVRELQARYGHVALFMYNSMAPNAIGIVWRPSAYTQSTFNAMNSRYCMPVASDSGSTSSSSSSSVLAKGTQVVPNVTQILAEIQALGGDMIESIHITQ
eukprot:14120-Heterococcus_DN1.PRE.2